MSYSKYETIGGQASEGVTFSVLIEHLRLAQEQAYVLGHLKKLNGDELIGQGFLAIGENLKKTVALVTQLAMRKAN